MKSTFFGRLACVSVVASLAATQPVVAQTASNDGAELEEVVVVGTRGQPRSVFDSAVPIDVLSAEDLESTVSLGGEFGELLNALSPSFNFPRQSASGAADQVRSGGLRGLNPDHVLVLVNGKRQHTTPILFLEGAVGNGNAPFDFNTIPIGSIERVEILRDGASAQYGSDAVAGVINVVTKSGSEGGNVYLNYGANVTEVEPQDRDVTDGQTFSVGADVGFDIGNDGFLRIGFDYRDRNGTARGGVGMLPFFENQSPENLATNNTVQFAPGDGDSEDLWLHYNAETSFGSDNTFYSFGRYYTRDSEGVGFYRFPDSSGNILSVNPNGFLPITTGESDDLSLTFGARGEGTWRWDLSLTYGMGMFDQGVDNSLNPSLGPTSPTSFDIAEYERTQLTINADIARDFDVDGLGGPLTVAFGAEYRTEDFETTAGDEASFTDGGFGGNVGAETGPGLTPESEVDIDRSVYGMYADITAPITENFTLGAAVRYEDYDDFGDATTGKLTAFWRLSEIVALRAAVSNSFRAPAIQQLGFENFTQNFGPGGQLVQIGQVTVDNPIAIANGAVPLTEEKSTNFSAGIVITPDNGFSLTIDAYKIDIDDRIALIGVPTVNITYFTNLADTETEGVDVAVTYGTEAWGGQLDFSLAGTWVDQEVQNPGTLSQVFLNTLEGIQPESKIILSGQWEGEALSVLLRLTEFGETTRDFDFGGGFPPPQTYDAKVSTDIEVGYKLQDNWKIVVGADNVFDQYTDLSDSNGNFFGHLPYDVISGIGFNGRFVYARTSFSF